NSSASFSLIILSTRTARAASWMALEPRMSLATRRRFAGVVHQFDGAFRLAGNLLENVDNARHFAGVVFGRAVQRHEWVKHCKAFFVGFDLRRNMRDQRIIYFSSL